MQNGKLLLRSSGITNDSIQKVLVELLGKAVSESKALYLPTALYADSTGIQHAWQALKIVGELGWKELGVLELTALPALPKSLWMPQIEQTDLLFVGGGNKFYLSHWMEKSGLFEMLPQLLESCIVYVRASAGSMILTPTLNFGSEHLKVEEI